MELLFLKGCAGSRPGDRFSVVFILKVRCLIESHSRPVFAQLSLVFLLYCLLVMKCCQSQEH